MNADPPTAIRWGTPQARWVLLATVLGSGMAFLDSTVVSVALPAIGRDLHVGMAGLQWTVTGYMISLAALILLGGSLGDRYGRRRVFEVGVVWFAVTSLLCGLAADAPMLVAARMLQGVGAALLTPGSLAMIEASFAPADRARAVGAWSGLTGVGAAVGPFVGGWLVDAGSWRLIFVLNLPLAVVVVLAARRVPESRNPDAAHRIDLPGSLLAVVGLAALTYGLIEAGPDGALAPVVVGAAALGCAALAGFVVVERRSRHPMLPLEVFASRQFTAANLVTVTVYAALGVVFFLLVVHLQQVLGYSAVRAGLASLPVTILMLALSSPSGALAQRIGPRAQMTVGPLMVAAAMLLMRRIEPGSSYLGSVLPAVLLLGLGLATTVAPLTATVLASAEDRYAGVASGVNNAVARTGQLLAVAVVPVVVGLTGDAYRDPAVFAAGFRDAMTVTAGIAAAGGLLAFATIRNPLAERRVEQVPGVPAPRAAPEAPRHCAFDTPPLERCPRTEPRTAPRAGTAAGDGVTRSP